MRVENAVTICGYKLLIYLHIGDSWIS